MYNTYLRAITPKEREKDNKNAPKAVPPLVRGGLRGIWFLKSSICRKLCNIISYICKNE
jgi:hypothetical protein